MAGRDGDADREESTFEVSERRGFTLLELLIALVLLDIGLLALVGLGATLARESNTGRAALVAISLASARLERLASVTCAGPIAGSERPTSAIVESFSDSPAPNDTRRVTDSVRVTTSRGTQIVALSTGARC